MNRTARHKTLFFGILFALLLGTGVIAAQGGLRDPEVPQVEELPQTQPQDRPTSGEPITFERVPVEGSMPEAPAGERPADLPASPPLTEAPALGPAPVGVPVAGTLAFDKPDLTGWRFGQVYADGTRAPAWRVADGRLIAADNSQALTAFNNTLALVPLPGRSIEVAAQARTASAIGLVLAYVDDQNYLALTLGAQDAPGLAGTRLIRVVDGQRTVLAQSDERLDRNRWYQLGLSLDGATLTARVDGRQVLSATVDAAPLVSAVGLYAGSEGYAFFDNLRVLGN